MLKRVTVSSSVAVLVSAVAACGSGGGGGGGGGGEGFAAEANGICADAARQASEVLLENPGADAQDAQARIEQQKRIDARALRELRPLEPTEERAARYDDYLAARERLADQLDDGLAAAEAEDLAAFEAGREEARSLGEEEDRIAEDLGLDVCAGQLPDAEEERVRAAVEENIATEDAQRYCDELITESFVEQSFGGRENCLRAQMGPSPKLLEIVDVRGVEGAGVTVELVASGGPAGPEPDLVEFGLIEQDGEYRLNAVVPIEEDVETPVGDAGEAGSPALSAFQAARDDLDQAIAEFNDAVPNAGGSVSVAAAQAAARAVRDAFFEFDEAVRELEATPEAKPALDDLLAANGRVIADLDAVAAASGAEEATDLVNTAIDRTQEAGEAARQLEAALRGE